MSTTVLCDVDGVIADFTGALNKLIHGICGIDYPITEWFDMKKLPVPAQEKKEIAYQIGKLAGVLEPLPGAQAGVQALRAAGCDVHFVTSRWGSRDWVEDRCAWMERHKFVKSAHHEVTFCAQKWRVHGDVLVDDKPKNVVDWQLFWPNGIGIVWAQPWNENCVPRRFNDWVKLLELANGQT